MVSRASLAFCKNNRVLSIFVLYRRKRFNYIVSYFHEAEQSYMHDHDHEREEKKNSLYHRAATSRTFRYAP